MEENKDIQIEKEDTGSSRRSFMKKGAVVAAPIVLSVFSRPVLALTRQCTVSGAASGPHSGEDEVICVTGFSPGYWKTSDIQNKNKPDIIKHPWPIPWSTPMSNYYDSQYGDLAMLTILQEYNSNGLDKGGPEYHFIAATLNVLHFKSDYVLDQTYLDMLWGKYKLEEIGYDSSALRDFLDTTWTLTSDDE